MVILEIFNFQNIYIIKKKSYQSVEKITVTRLCRTYTLSKYIYKYMLIFAINTNESLFFWPPFSILLASIVSFEHKSLSLYMACLCMSVHSKM